MFFLAFFSDALSHLALFALAFAKRAAVFFLTLPFTFFLQALLTLLNVVTHAPEGFGLGFAAALAFFFAFFSDAFECFSLRSSFLTRLISNLYFFLYLAFNLIFAFLAEEVRFTLALFAFSAMYFATLSSRLAFFFGQPVFMLTSLFSVETFSFAFRALIFALTATVCLFFSAAVTLFFFSLGLGAAFLPLTFLPLTFLPLAFFAFFAFLAFL